MLTHVEHDILFNTIPGKAGHIGEILLNRPKALNALTRDMCRDLHQQLQKWQADPNIKAVIIRGAGERAFCAGGDIRALYQNKQDPEAALSFFQDEYAMNKAIFHFKKPYIAFLHGITMGGGVGVSMHGSHRVGSESLVFAMPETGIGFFPDIGAGYFLSRLANKMGYYLGLTGDRIRVADTHWLGLVTHIIPQDQHQTVIDVLAATTLGTDADQQVSQILNHFTIKLEPQLINHQSQISDCFSASSVEEVMLRLEENNSEWSLAVTKTLLAKSPTSLKVTFEQLTRANTLSFDEIMQMEFNIAWQFLRTPDFFEGVRAAVIDKDQNPQWQPPLLEEVSPQQVATFFQFKEKLK